MKCSSCIVRNANNVLNYYCLCSTGHYQTHKMSARKILESIWEYTKNIECGISSRFGSCSLEIKNEYLNLNYIITRHLRGTFVLFKNFRLNPLNLFCRNDIWDESYYIWSTFIYWSDPVYLIHIIGKKLSTTHFWELYTFFKKKFWN